MEDRMTSAIITERLPLQRNALAPEGCAPVFNLALSICFNEALSEKP